MVAFSGDRGWDGWMASPTQWTWVWVNSRSWWWTGRSGVLQFMGLQRVGHDWATELNWYVVQMTVIGNVMEGGFLDLHLYLSTLLFWSFQLSGIFKRLILNYLNFSAAAAAKSLQSCPTLCDPRDGSPPGSPVPGILQARTLEWVAISFSNAWKWKVKAKSFSRVRLLATPWTAAYQAPPSMGFPRQEYWSGVPLPSPNFFCLSLKISYLVPHLNAIEKHIILCW